MCKDSLVAPVEKFVCPDYRSVAFTSLLKKTYLPTVMQAVKDSPAALEGT